MRPPLDPEDPRTWGAPPPASRRPRWQRAIEITSAVVVAVTVTALAVGGLAVIGLWIILIVGMNNFGSNK